MRTTIALSLALALLPACADDGGLCAMGEQTSTEVVVTSQLRFVVPDEDGVSEGFDIDGRVSDASDTPSCRRPDYVAPDGTPGIDNQFAQLWNILVAAVGDAVEGLIQGVINDGTLLLIFRVDGIDDPENDSCVRVSLFKGAGRPALGTDGFIAPSQTFDVAQGTPYTETAGYIEDGVLHAGPFDAVIPIAIFQVVADLKLEGAFLEATFTEEGGLSGTIAGGVSDDQIMQVAEMAAENDGTAQRLLPSIPLFLGLAADLARSDEDNKCHQLSTVMRFEGEPAYLYADAIDPSL